MKKNIKITTFQRAHNFGAFLQVFSLQYILGKYGYNVKVVDYLNKNIDSKKPSKIIKSNIKWTIKSSIEYILYHKALNKKYTKFNNIIESKLNLTSKIKNVNDLENIVKKNDILITGSDQVWNSTLTKGVDDIYTLNIKSKNIKRISYAASIGNVKNIDKYRNLFINNISKIDSISVREKSTKKYFADNLKIKNVENTIDPTLLVDRQEWEKIVKSSNNQLKEKYILAYDVAPNAEYVNIVNYVSKEKNLKVLHFDIKNLYNNEYKNCFSADPFEFLEYLKNAEYIITTSFHATVFSIIFRKNFIVVPHITTGSRVRDLLDDIGLNNRAVSNIDELDLNLLNEVPNYSKIEKTLEVKKQKSIEWLINSIEN